MHVLFCSTVFFIGLPCDSTRTIKGLVKVLCLIPSCIAKLVTSTVLKFCNSRACQWLVRVSKFPMAALEAKRFGFAFDRSSSPSPSSTQPSDHGRQSNPHSHVLTWRLGQNSPARTQIRKPDAPGRNVWHQEVSQLGPL